MTTVRGVRLAYSIVFLFIPLLLTSKQLSATLIDSVFINEIHYDNKGSDIDELIELAVVLGTDLTDWRLDFYNGSNGKIYSSILLNGTESINNHDSGYGFLSLSAAGMQNGPDAISLVSPNNIVAQFISYEGVFSAVDGAASGLTSFDIGVGESSSTEVGFSMQLSGQGYHYNDFYWVESLLASADSKNADQVFIEPSVGKVFSVPEPNGWQLLLVAALFWFAIRSKHKTIT